MHSSITRPQIRSKVSSRFQGNNRSTCTVSLSSVPARSHRSAAATQSLRLLQSCRMLSAPCSGQPSAASSPNRRVNRSQFAATASGSEHALQLATAKLPKDVDVATFQAKLYQWANALTTNSTNLPLVLPLRIDSIDSGFQMSMLRIRDDNRPAAVANIAVTVEKEDAGNILFVRLTEADGSEMVLPKRGTSGGISYLEGLATSLIDVAKIVNSMPPAIKLAVVQSRN